MPLIVRRRALACANPTYCLCKESACLSAKLGGPISADGVVSPTVLSTASNTSAVGGPTAAAAHPLDSVTVHTGTAFTGIISSAPGASTSARHCQPALSCSPMPTNPTHPTRRTPHQPRRPELSPAREIGDRLGIWRRALARLGQPCGLPTYPQTDDYALASLAVYHSKQRLSDQSDAGSAVPVCCESRLRLGCRFSGDGVTKTLQTLD
jgi:hypothetical protein